MQDLLVMQRLESTGDIGEGLPDLVLLNSSPCLGIGGDESHEISPLGELHDDTEVAGEVVIESLLEFNDEVIVEGGQNTDLIEGVLFLLLFHANHAHFLQRVDFVIFLATHLVDLSEGSLADLLHDLEVLDAALCAIIHL